MKLKLPKIRITKRRFAILAIACLGAWLALRRGYDVVCIAPPTANLADDVRYFFPRMLDDDTVTFQKGTAIYRARGGVVELASAPGDRVVLNGEHRDVLNYGTVGDKTFYVRGGPAPELVVCENGVSTAALNEVDAKTFVNIHGIRGDGKSLLFWADHLKERRLALLWLKDGKLEDVGLKYRIVPGKRRFIVKDQEGAIVESELAHRIADDFFDRRKEKWTSELSKLKYRVVQAEPDELSMKDITYFDLSNDRIYCASNTELFVCGDGKIRKLLSLGQELDVGTVRGIRAWSASDGAVTVTVGYNEKEGGKENYGLGIVREDGAVSVSEFADGVSSNTGSSSDPQYGEYGYYVSHHALRGKQIAEVQYDGYHMSNNSPNHRHRVAVASDGKFQTVVKTEEWIDGTLAYDFALGPQAVNREGNVAFKYGLKYDNSSGIAVGYRRRWDAILSAICFALASTGLIAELIARRRNRTATIQQRPDEPAEQQFTSSPEP